MTTYNLKFLPIALREWKKLDKGIQRQLKKKLAAVLENPKLPANRLRKLENHYKIKLKASGYRLVYEVIDNEVVVLVIAVGKREGNRVYEAAAVRAADD